MKKTLALLAAVAMLLCGVACAEIETFTEPEVIQNPVGGSITIPVTTAMDANFEEDSYGGGSDGYSYELIHAYT